MENNYSRYGMYLTRPFFDWLLSKNEELTQPYETFEELVKAFSRSTYKRFIQEQNIMMNDFFYHIKKQGTGVVLERSVDLLFVPYELILSQEEDIKALELTDDFVISYSNTCMGGGHPDRYKPLNQEYLSSLMYSSFPAYHQLADEKNLYETYLEVTDGSNVSLSFLDFYAAEENNSMELHRDHLDFRLTYRMKANVIKHLISEMEELGIVGTLGQCYELRLLTYAEAIMQLSTDKYKVGEVIPLDEIYSMSNSRLNKLTHQNDDCEYLKMCQQIKKAREETIHFEVLDTYPGKPICEPFSNWYYDEQSFEVQDELEDEWYDE